MEVVISGQAGIYASVKPPVLYSLDSREAISLKTHNLGLAFQGCNDAKRVQVDTIDQAREACEVSWANDRSLRCILMFLDSSEAADDRLEFAECVEELISDFSTGAFLLNQLSCSPLPPSADLSMLDRLLESCPQTLAVLHQIVRDQPIIEGVSEALQSRLKEVFEDGRQRSSFFELLVDVGASRGLVDAIRDNSNIDMLVMRLIGQFRHIEGARRLIESWTAGMRSKKKINVPSAPDTEEFENFESSGQAAAGSGRRAFEQAMKQQAAIVSKLKSRDLDGARRFVDDLIATQKVSSSPEHIGKSLSKLSHEAKELGVPELHIEWAEEAVKANPSDPITFSHLSDALISAFRFNEALAAIESMESLGASLAAANARARILRMTGRFEEARVVYLAAAQSNPFDPTVTYALQGAAEVLRDMSLYDEALSEYTKLTETYPLEGAIWAGRASVLMDLGRFDEAISTFRISETHGSARVPKNGRATAYRRRGELTRALKLYDEVVREFPNDPVALCGRAEVYRDQGNLDAALIDYRIAVERSPFTPTPIMGLVETLKDLRCFNEAIDLTDKAVRQFPLHAGLASLRAGLLLRQSKFEDALAAYDDLIGQFPFHMPARKYRADVLRRIGNFEGALQEYNLILELNPHFVHAKLSKLSLLIELRRFQEVMPEFPSGQPKSELDWKFYFLKALALDAISNGKKGDALFGNGIRNAPFARQRRLFAAALGRKRLLHNQFSKSIKVIESEPGEVSNVIWLHALAASGHKARAKSTFEDIISTETSASIIELSREIVSRFNIVDLPSRRTREWIFEAEQRELLLEAA